MIILQWNSNGNGVQKTLKRNGRNEVVGMTMIHDMGAERQFDKEFLEIFIIQLCELFQHNIALLCKTVQNRKSGTQAKVKVYL